MTDDEDRAVDTAWLRAAVSAIETELEHRLTFDQDFEAFAETLGSLNGMAQEFVSRRGSPAE